MANILVVGRRRSCYKAAQKLGHQVFLWSDSPLHESRKRNLAGWIEQKFDSCKEDIPSSILNEIRTFQIDFVVAATESSVELAAKIRHQLNLPGTSLEVANLLHDKYQMKLRAREFNIPITSFHLIDENDTSEFLIEKLGLPLVIKPLSESGARGVSIIQSALEAEPLIKPGLLAESFVAGSEVSVETFIHAGKPIFHNITDYIHQWRKSIMPAELDEALAEKILALNDQALKAFGVESGITHAEFYLTKEGPVFGEMAVRPPGGYYMDLMELSYGFDPWKLYVQLETKEEPDIPNNRPLKYSSVLMIHPGEGTVASIEGLDQVKSIAEIDRFKLKADVGDQVSSHVSTSSEIGHIIMSSSNNKKLLENMEFIEQNLVIKLD